MMENICCILDFEGFRIKINGDEVSSKQFLIREMGFVRFPRNILCIPKSYSFDLRCFRWKDIAPEDRHTIRYQQMNIHGIPFYPNEDEDSIDYSLHENLIRICYNRAASDNMNVVAFKGGECEKELLDRMGIPSIDIGAFGCPSFKELLKENPTYAEHICSLHKSAFGIKNVHCPKVEVMAFRDWLWEKYGFS